MKRRIFFLLSCMLSQFSLSAQPFCTLLNNLKSISMSYVRLPPGDTAINDFRFLFRTIVECGQSNSFELHDLVVINPTNALASIDQSWQLDSFNKITGLIDPCLSLPAAPCYSVNYYHADVNLESLGYAPFGFIANTINCCRPGNAVNLLYPPQYMDQQNPPPQLPCPEYPLLWYPSVIGNALVNFIHLPPISFVNNSPQFSSSDTILFVCKNRDLSYQIRAFDPDGDSIAYHFSQPRTFFAIKFTTYSNSNFPQVGYTSGYSDLAPAGPGITLDQKTGLLQGSISDTGTYVITISVPEYRNNQVIDSVTKDLLVRVFDCGLLPKPVASIPDSINSCADFTIPFPNNSFPLYSDVNFNNSTFLWSFGDGDSSIQVYPSHTYADTGTYNARLIIFPGLYCADTAYSKVLVYPFVNAAFNYNDSCNGQLIQFNNTSSSTSGSITSTQWKILEDSTLLFNSGQFNTAYTFQKASQTYEVSLNVSNDIGCVARDSQYISISQSPYPLPSHDTILSLGATLQLMVNDGNQNYGGQYNWWPSYGLSDPDIADPLLSSTVDTTYHVSIINRYGCALLDSIIVKYYTGPDIYVPNAFTPNGDGLNDIFKPVPVGISVINYFRVFNRNGQLVFQTEQSGQGWDGTLHGTPAVMDTYVWEVKGIDYTGKPIFKKGTVVLIR